MPMEWTRGHTIGHGATAAVSVAVAGFSSDVFAVKSTELSRSEPLQREHKIHSNLNSPYVIGYRGCEVSLENNVSIFNLVLEYAPGGTVSDDVRRRGGHLDEVTARHYTCQIVKGLEYLHSRGIVHCDIKGSNLLLCRGGAVKIADFGCAKAAGSAEAAIGGTPMYMAPEVVRGEEQGFPADIWALACTVIEMSAGRPPWPNATTTVRRIAYSGESPEIPGSLSDCARDFLSKCLRIDPKERWTAKQLLRHPFLEEFEIPTGSPTSVLDGGVWSSAGDHESSRDSVRMDFEDSDSSESAKQRIKELRVKSGKENWESGERWITVRDSEKIVNICGKFRGQKSNWDWDK